MTDKKWSVARIMFRLGVIYCVIALIVIVVNVIRFWGEGPVSVRDHLVSVIFIFGGAGVLFGYRIRFRVHRFALNGISRNRKKKIINAQPFLKWLFMIYATNSNQTKFYAHGGTIFNLVCYYALLLSVTIVIIGFALYGFEVDVFPLVRVAMVVGAISELLSLCSFGMGFAIRKKK